MNRDERPLDLTDADTEGALEASRAVLSRLPAEQREIVVLLSYYRLTRDEIAALLGQPIAQVDALFRTAVRSLRQLLAPQRHSMA